MARFTIRKSNLNQYYFRLEATGNNEPILTSEMYNTKNSCEGGISSVKVNAPFDRQYDRLDAVNKQYYFNLKGGNGEIIGTSETYTTTGNRDTGIEIVKIQAPHAVVVDLTL